MANLESSIAGEARPYLERIENIMADMESKRGKYMAEAKADREDIKDIYTEAKADGVPPKALKGVVRYRELEKRQKAIAAGLDIDEQSTYESLVEALGDFAATPLGEATVAKAKPKSRKPKSDVETRAKITAAEQAEKIDEIDKSFTERLREQNAAVNQHLNDGTFGEEEQEPAAA